MKHSTAFTLCLTVIVLTGVVTASVGLLIFKEQDVALLQQRITDLRNENQALRARLDSITLAEQVHTPGEAEPSGRP